MIKILILLRYLEKEELAVFFEPAQNTDKTIEFGMGAVNLPCFSMSIDDQNIVNLLIKFVHKEIVPSPSLRKLENTNFISDEDIKFTKQYLATWAAIIFSMFLGLYGFYNNHQNSLGQKRQFKKQIEENQKSTKQISQKLENLIKSRIDYSDAIDNISEEISRLTDKVELMPKHQTVEIKLSKESKKN